MPGREKPQPETKPEPPTDRPASANPSVSADPPEAGRFAYDGLERVIHERARLSILTSLSGNTQGLSFNDLKQLCQLTDGNLSRQLQLLQETGFVDVVKGTRNNRPHTQVLLTEVGRERFLGYIAVLEGVVADAMAAANSRPAPLAPLARVRGAVG